MYVKRNYGFIMTFMWSKNPFIYGFLYASLIHICHSLLPVSLTLPWQPVSVLGIAVAFYLGFKNNSSYDRLWEARKIWGAIVNHSRTFSTAVITMIKDPMIQRRIIHRHVAWLTALRYQLRLSREWEHQEDRLKARYMPVVCEAYIDDLCRILSDYMRKEEIDQIKNKSNIASQILLLQAKDISTLHDMNNLSDFKHIRLHEVIGWLYDEQGKSERIKNFPFPRQYSSTALWLTWVFAALTPFGMLEIFTHNDENAWIAILLSALVIWVFFLMEKIGDYSENPFEGTYNDVPISSISRSIEIDIREMINDDNIPQAIKEEDGFLL